MRARALIAWLSMGFCPVLCGAVPTLDRANALKRLQSGQDAIDNALGRLRGTSGLSEGAREKSESEAPSRLLQVHGSLSGARLPVGKVLYGHTLNRLVVGGDESPVLVALEGPGPSGLRLLGIARASASDGRVVLEFKQLLTPAGREIPIHALGLDSEGALGVRAEVFSSKALSVLGGMATSFISGLAAGSQSQAVSPFGFSATQPTGRNALLQGVAQTAADQSKRLIEEATAEKPVLVVSPETPVSVLVQEEVRL